MYVHTYAIKKILEYTQIVVTGGNSWILDIEGHSMAHVTFKYCLLFFSVLTVGGSTIALVSLFMWLHHRK